MMDSFELNKIMGAILGTLLITLALNIVAGGIFTPHKPAKPGFEIAVTEAPSAAAGPAAPEVPIEQLLASASAEKGAAVSKKCLACHEFKKGGPNKVGPDLYGVVGRERGSHEGFAYSTGMKAKPGKWTFEDLNHFLTSPRQFIPGTAMAFAGISKATDRADLLVYLNTLSESPQPLPKAPAPAADQKAEAPKGEAPKGEAPKGAEQKDGDQKNAAPAPQGQNGQPKAAPAPTPQGQPKATPAPAPKQ
jgi:cytochrome c